MTSRQAQVLAWLVVATTVVGLITVLVLLTLTVAKFLA